MAPILKWYRDLKEGDEVIISMSGDGSTTTKKTTGGSPGSVPILRQSGK